jgi:hypothetical protein
LTVFSLSNGKRGRIQPILPKTPLEAVGAGLPAFLI